LEGLTLPGPPGLAKGWDLGHSEGMETTKNPALLAASLAGFTGVALGAFGAHALQAFLSAQALTWWQTAVDYHLVHAVVLVAVALGLKPGVCRAVAVAGLVGGVALFSGSLYVLALTGEKGWGLVTPLGGVSFLVGWGAIGWAAWKQTPLYRTPSDQ